MLIIKHRVNTIEDLKSTLVEYGVEIDIRPEGNKLILHHDPFTPGEDFEEWLKHYKHAFLILNIKSEGIEKRVIELMEKYQIQAYFLLDVAPPFLTKLAKQNIAGLSTRLSPFESVKTCLEYARAFPGQFTWVFVDVMTKTEGKTKLPLNGKMSQQLKEAGYKICLVSPELLNRENQIAAYKKKLGAKGITIDAVLTKKPELWST
ncbi:hypothetical protein J4210_03390 [Candidatus Woesearchaeota archaeon]|nr:hypothetical protein [Candidatus Woesearchaeota archaeon]